jgi:ribosomal protein L5
MLIKNHYKNIFLYNYFLQYNIRDIQFLPKFKFINLNLGLNNEEIEKEENLIFSFFILFIITNQKPTFIKLKKKSKILKLKKNSTIGCNVNLRNKNLFKFLNKIIILLRFKFNCKTSLNGVYNCKIKKIKHFSEIENEILLLKKISNINFNLKIKNLNKENSKIFLKNFNFKN